MPRLSKIEVSAINLRIPADRSRDYTDLIQKILQNRLAIKVYGNSFVAITYFNTESKIGNISKYDEIDIDGDWFDIDNFTRAEPDRIGEVSIPDSLRPNLTSFNFFLDEENHILVFESYAESKGLSARAVEKYFHGALSQEAITSEFGRVEADIIKNYGEVERIINLPDLKELRIVIRRPNPDDISGDLANEIEERLREQNGEEYEEVIRSKDENGINPNERTKKLAFIGAENGEVFGKNVVNGVKVTHTTSQKPEKIVDTYQKDEVNPRSMFMRLARQMIQTVTNHRAS